MDKKRTYEVVLGKLNPIDPDIFEEGVEIWLSLTVHFGNGSAEVLPRQYLATAAYAFKAHYAERLYGGSLSLDVRSDRFGLDAYRAPFETATLTLDRTGGVAPFTYEYSASGPIAGGRL
jgi:hypothetical protein